MSKPICQARWLGRVEYGAARALQEQLAQQRREGAIPDTLLLLEHPPTFTLGRAARPEHILASPAEREREGIVVLESDRGGDITYHGPGQLVGYPILNLQAPPHHADLHRYLRDIEETLIRALAAFGVEAGRFTGYTGVWTLLDTPYPAKIAAIGIKTNRWITQHGFALNVQPNLAHFQMIVPCGISGYGVTSLHELLQREIALDETLPIIIGAFADVFGLNVEYNSLSQFG
jgi:lipoate-protein ligase B